MNGHLDTETISAYLDAELEAAERARAEAHMAGCAQCASQRMALQTAAISLGRLSREEITTEEHRVLRQALLSARTPPTSRWSFLSLRRWWALAGGLGVALIAVVGVLTLRPSPHQTLDQAAAPEAGQALVFTSGQQIEAAVSRLPEVTGTSGRRAGNGAGPGIAQTRQGDTSEAKPPAASVSERGSDLGGGDGGDGDGGEGEDSSAGALKDSANAEGFALSPQGGDMCLRKVAEAGPPDLIPLVAKEATFNGQPAWLLVYAFGPEGSVSNDRRPPRGRIVVWLVPPADCLDYAGAELLDRALYHSTFDRP